MATKPVKLLPEWKVYCHLSSGGKQIRLKEGVHSEIEIKFHSKIVPFASFFSKIVESSYEKKLHLNYFLIFAKILIWSKTYRVSI